MRNSCGGLEEGRVTTSTRPGCVRQASGVDVVVGAGEGVNVGGGGCVAVDGSAVDVGVAVGWFNSKGEQA